MQQNHELPESVDTLVRLTVCPCCGRPRFNAKELLEYLPEGVQCDEHTIAAHVETVIAEIDLALDHG